MNAIIFGGSGFLGRYVAEELLQQGHCVYIADLCESDCIHLPNLQFIKCNIKKYSEVEQVISSSDADIVYNFAALADLNKSIHNPLESMNTNVIGNLNILEISRKANIKHFIYASSVYACSNKASFYGISKFTSEKLIEEYHKKYGLNYTILRYGSLYGPNVDSSNGMCNFLTQALKGKIIHKGNGQEIREYIHVRDAAKLSVDIINKEQFKNKTFVLTGVEPICQADLFKMIKEILDEKLEIEYDDVDYHGHYKYTPYSFTPTVAGKLTPNPFTDLGQGIVECLEELSRRQD